MTVPETNVALAVAAGGRLWEGGTLRRVYFDNWPELCGLETVWRPPGRLVRARLWGEEISPTTAQRVMRAVEKVWLNIPTGRVAVHLDPAVLLPLDPTPQVLRRRITAGVRAAVDPARRA
jgi:hypothetical protein